MNQFELSKSILYLLEIGLLATYYIPICDVCAGSRCENVIKL